MFIGTKLCMHKIFEKDLNFIEFDLNWPEMDTIKTYVGSKAICLVTLWLSLRRGYNKVNYQKT